MKLRHREVTQFGEVPVQEIHVSCVCSGVEEDV